MNDNQIAIYCEAIRDTTIRQFYKIQNQRKEISMLHKKCKSQQAEIERLNSPYEMQVEASKKLENSIKAEAVKECIEKIKSKAAKCVMTDNGIPVAGSASYSISEVELYKIEKEMVGAESGSIL